MRASRLLGAALLAFAGSALAGGPLTICTGGIPVKYPGAGTVDLNYDQGTLGARTKAQADAIVAAAVANWTNVATATVTIGRGADLPVDVTTANVATYVGGAGTLADGLNPVVYDTDGSIIDQLLGVGAKNNVLGFAGSGFNTGTCQYLEGQAVINGFLTTSDVKLRIVLAHEIGHLIGLDHTQLDDEQGLSQAGYPLMYPIAFRATDALHEDDVASVTALYPEATMNATYGQVTGYLRQADGVTPVRGANIWAKEVATGSLYSVVSDFLQQGDGYFRLLLPTGTYNLFVGAIDPAFTGGSSVGPYSETSGGFSFQPPLYNGGVPITAVILGGGTPVHFAIVPGCVAAATFNLDGAGSIGGNCGSPQPEVFPPGGTMPAGYVQGETQQRDLFLNTSFETLPAFTSWTTTGSWNVLTTAPFLGSRHAQFSLANGTAGDNLTGDLYQTVTIPFGISAAAATYQLAVVTQETTTTQIFDELVFEIRTTGGVLLADGGHSNLDAGGYRFVGWNLSPFAGQTVRVGFAGFTDNTLPTLFRLDDVRMRVEANPAWTVASDQANEGVYSLKSGFTPDNFQSDLVYSNDFVAGNVSFARRVSSQANDFLQFYIDDVLQQQWSGEVPWSTVTFPLDAGVHTLRWTYKKSSTPGSAGADAAWIDSVVLPGIAGESYAVTVGKSGMGTGTVTSSPGGINCGATCSAAFPAGDITLTATPDAGSTFNSWTGSCAGSGAVCNLSLNGAKNTTAVFDAIPSYTLTVTVNGNGTVTSSPAGINCPGDCTEPYLDGTPVQLTATPGSGAVFTGWSGACTGTGTCNVSMTAARAVTATFVTDTTPDTFTFTDVTNVALGSVQTSNAVTIAGITAPATISVTGGTYSIGCTVTFTAADSTINNGQSVCVRHTASGSFSTATDTILTIGGVSDTFTSTTLASDTTPNTFAFTDVTNVALGSVQTSNSITVAGINTAAAISVTGGTYSIGCTTFTAVAGTINNGESVCVQHTASASFSTATNTTLTIGGVSDTFTSTTLAADTTPTAFTFTDVSNVALGSVQTSDVITVAGINTAAAISVSGGTYSIGCTGTFTASAGTINNGETVCVQHTASGGFSTATNTTLTIGGVSDIFTSTTLAADTTPDAFAFTDQTNVALGSVVTSDSITVGGINTGAPISVTGGTYSIGCTGTFTATAGTINNGQGVCVRHTASATPATATNTILTIGGVSDTFTSTTVAADTTPDTFVFTDVTDAALGSVQTSNSITVAGINTAAAISVTGGTYSIGCTGTFTASAGTIANGQGVCVRHTASAIPATATNTVLTIGGVSDTFTSTTVPPDTTPDPFAFTDVNNVALSSVQTSNSIIVAGINTAAAISVTGGTYSIGCTGTFTASAGTINNGQSVCVRHTASATPATATDTTLTIGGVSDTFTSTTVGPDTTPDVFAFNDVTNVALSSVQTSNAIIVSGINTGAPISVTGGTYSIGCTATFTAAAGTITNGQSVCVQHAASASFSTATNTTLTIGGVSDTFTSTTLAADTTPDAFAFTDVTNVALGSEQTSNSITVAGINTGAPISVTGGTYSIGCTGTFTAFAGTIANGQSVCVRHTASATPATATNTILTIGGVSDTFTSTTVGPDTTPDPFAFTDQTNVALGSVVTSDSITVGGINTGAPISVTGGTYSIGCTGTFTATAGTINNGQGVCVRHTASATPATATNTILTIGGVSDTFMSTTVAADTTPDAFAFTDVTDAALGSVQTSNSITVAGINTAAAISVTGGTYSIGCTGTFTASAGTIANGQGVCVRHTASAIPATATSTVLTIGGVSDTFTSTTVPPDTTPDPFAFTDVNNVALSSVQTSNSIIVAGINTAAAISVTGGTYSIGCTGTFTASAGTINNGQSVCVRHTASATPATATDTTLTIGGVSDTFTSTTVGPDTTPDVFAFNDVTNVALSSVQTSNAIIVSGINTGAPISVTGGTYSIGCTATFTAAAGTITNGQSVCVQHAASASFSTATNTTLTIGGVSDTFTSTTLAEDTTPNTFTFTDQANVALSSVVTSDTITVAGINSPAAISVTGGTYSIGCTGTFTAFAGTIANGQSVCVRHTASATPATATNTVLTIGGVSDTFTSTTVAPDTTPDAFAFTDVTNAALGSEQTSNSIIVAGINTAAAISVSGGTYSIGCTGTFTAVASTITNGQGVCVRHTASATPGTATNTTLTIGGVSDTFTSTTVGPDTTPDAFAFTDVTDAALGVVQTSNSIIVAGINTAAAISVSGGTYSIGCTATFTAVAGTITNGQGVCVRHTASATPATATNTVLTIGGVPDTFTSTTVPPDTTPDPFAFTDVNNVALSSVQTSNSIIVAGINTAAAISVTGGTYSIGCTGTFTASAGTIANGQGVCVSHTASATPATATSTILTIGGVSDTFTSTTVPADTTPDTFAFTDVTNVALSSVQTSNFITVGGINTGAPISVTGGTYSIGCTATFTAAAGTINNGQTVCVQHTASGSFSTATNTTLTIGGVSDTFTSTTLAADTTPDTFTFIDVTSVALGSEQTSNSITVAGINTGAPISVTGGTYSIGCTGTFTAVVGTINNGQSVCVRHTASVGSATATNTVLTIGGVSDTFTSTTADTTPDAFAFTDVTNVALGSVQTSNAIIVSGINAAAFISVTGGTYSIGCSGTFTVAVGVIANGQSVCVRHTSSGSFTTATDTVLTIGGVSDTFTSTTLAADTTPDTFTFTDVADVALDSVQTSNAIIVAGINTAATISVTGGTYSIGCTVTFTASAGTIANGQSVCVRHTASATPATATNTVLTIGGVADTFTSTTVAVDTTPDVFTFTDVTDVALSSLQTSNVITVAGINSAAAISVSGGTYAIGCTGTFTAAAGTINNGQPVCVRHTASATPGTATNTVLTIGGVSDTFTSTTSTTDTTPDAFAFTDVSNVALSSVQTSNVATITGINAAAAISVTGGTYSIGCSTFTSAASTITSGQTVCVRHTASASNATTTSTVLTIGGVSGSFSSTTAANLPPEGDQDSDGIPNAVEIAESRDPFLKDNDIFGLARLFAMQQYRDFLGREGDAGGIDFYTDHLNAGTLVRANVIENFFNSPEFSGTVSPVVRLYFATFLRIPDYGGLEFQVAAYRAGTPLDVIANNFTLSPEFQATYGSLDNTQYVVLLYQNILGRTASTGEIDFHVARLVSGVSRGAVLVGFSESPEYQALTYNDVYVTMMYVGMLRRAPEQAGFDFWVDYMDTGNPGINLILGFLNAPEYRNRFLP